jgi:hypothetical protein
MKLPRLKLFSLYREKLFARGIKVVRGANKGGRVVNKGSKPSIMTSEGKPVTTPSTPKPEPIPGGFTFTPPGTKPTPQGGSIFQGKTTEIKPELPKMNNSVPNFELNSKGSIMSNTELLNTRANESINNFKFGRNSGSGSSFISNIESQGLDLPKVNIPDNSKLPPSVMSKPTTPNVGEAEVKSIFDKSINPNQNVQVPSAGKTPPSVMSKPTTPGVGEAEVKSIFDKSINPNQNVQVPYAGKTPPGGGNPTTPNSGGTTPTAAPENPTTPKLDDDKYSLLGTGALVLGAGGTIGMGTALINNSNKDK